MVKSPNSCTSSVAGCVNRRQARSDFLRAQTHCSSSRPSPTPPAHSSPSPRPSWSPCLLPSPASQLQQKQQHGAASLPRWRGGGVLNLQLAAAGGPMLRRSGCWRAHQRCQPSPSACSHLMAPPTPPPACSSWTMRRPTRRPPPPRPPRRERRCDDGAVLLGACPLHGLWASRMGQGVKRCR